MSRHTQYLLLIQEAHEIDTVDKAVSGNLGGTQ